VKPATSLWVIRAEGDLKVAELVLGIDLFEQCIFHCQQSLEKILKALWIERGDLGPPPKVHSLNQLAQGLGLDLEPSIREFLQRLTNQYIPTRYADYEVEFSREQTTPYLEQTLEVYTWLRTQLN
jgi:HEPN domain-containing protein